MRLPWPKYEQRFSTRMGIKVTDADQVASPAIRADFRSGKMLPMTITYVFADTVFLDPELTAIIRLE